MRITVFAAAAALSLSGTAFAGQDQSPTDLPARPIVSGQVLSQNGSESSPVFAHSGAIVTAGGVEMPNGSDAPVQSATSLPAGALDGTSAYAYAQSVQYYFAGQLQRLYAQQHGGRRS